MSTYYAVCDANGPISVRLEAETEGAAVLEFRRADTRSWIDDPRTDAEDDLGIEGEGMEPNEFEAALRDHGLALIMGLDVDPDLLGGWSLWRRAETDEGTDAVTLAGLTDEIRRSDRALAPGSETVMWAEYLAWVRRELDVDPLGDALDEITVTTEDADWWRGAYRIAEWAAKDPERWERHYGDAADDYWQFILDCCPDPATWTPPVPMPRDLKAWREREGLTQAEAGEVADNRDEIKPESKRRQWIRWEHGEETAPQWLREALQQRRGSAP